ncbi:MAG: U32 family peptidase [Clostridia bacterium]|nr:U32 family peptidase [Clostridia bacterium]
MKSLDMVNTKIEILAPAGDYDALVGAIYAGADAVYLGIGEFNARIRAENFTLESVGDAIRLAHAHGTKVYITLNTCLYDREVQKMLDSVATLYNLGADAFIVADLGVASVIRENYPEIELHASTQATIHNLDGANFISETLGMLRVVLARELDRENIEYISKNAKCETEIFVHGAHCMSVSGQCLMSYFQGGRSGNRGECAQPCRLPYTINGKNGYHLSLKDMSLNQHILEILNSGVASLKIEGRMKNEEYVSGTVVIWRRLIDEKRNASKVEKTTLGELFSRQGFTDGYYLGKIDGSMLGVRTQKDKDASKGQETKDIDLEKPKIDMVAELYLGEKAKLTIKHNGKEVTVYGDTVEKSINAPLSRENIIKNLSKLGSTPFSQGKIEVLKSNDIMVRVSSINDLRRQAIEKLFEVQNKVEPKIYKKRELLRPEKIKTAIFLEEEQIPLNANYFDVIFLPLDKYKTGSRANGVQMPPVVFDSEWQEIEAMLDYARNSGIEWALVSNIGQIKRVKEKGFKMIFDYRFNAFNAPCVDYLMKSGAENVILSPELTQAQIRNYKGYSVIAYGHIPMMTTHKCILKDTVGCEKCKGYMTDRQGARLYAHGIYGHRNIIYNSVPIYMADKESEINSFSHHFIFSSESKEKCQEIIEAYKNGTPSNGSIRRIK